MAWAAPTPNDPLTLADLRRVVVGCERFEADWRAGALVKKAS